MGGILPNFPYRFVFRGNVRMNHILDHIRRLSDGEKFSFECQPGNGCYTECCRQLDLALTPYDLIRLKGRLGMSSTDLLEKFCLIEEEQPGFFPQVYLAMIDDGRASCPFVSDKGCSVYADRPGACRAYPLGRASSLRKKGGKDEFHILLHEPHCLGLSRPVWWTAFQWMGNQGLLPYNEMNDAVMAVLQHPAMGSGKKLSSEEIGNYILALYDLDSLRDHLKRRELPLPAHLEASRAAVLTGNDVDLLRFGIQWLLHWLFNN